MDAPRRHPDLFTAAEAMDYLHLPADGDRTLKTFRDKGWLTGHQFGPELMYHREDLDACVAIGCKKAGVRSERGPRIKLAGGSV